MASKNIDFFLLGDPAAARATAEQALVGRQFHLSWNDDWTATAERGSKVANVLAGALAQHFKFGLRVMASPEPGVTILRIEKLAAGWAGGAIGVMRTNKNVAALRSDLEATFQGAGVLRGVTES